MARYSTKRMMFLLQLLTPILLLLPLFISSSSGEEGVNSSEIRVCVSKEGRSYQPYELLEGKLPESADLEFKNLNMCNVFHDKTCCSASSRMLSVSLALQNLATHGEASKDCLYLFELLECSICHPDVGVQSGPLRICASFCDSVFEACSDAYFSTHDQVIVPCGASNGTTICEKASELETNGTAFCEAVGFTVVQTPDDDSVEAPCYGSKTVLVEALLKTLRLQNLKYKLVTVYLMCWTATFFVLSTMLLFKFVSLSLALTLSTFITLLESMPWNLIILRWIHKIERDARRLRRLNMNGRRF
ncbi:unnamed protein product [Eruca vesicaria subsp. sativa]|uniref:Folate receptor-like domain-containing protein n=1 Tax=Eruca vesicaria subsp. sativa TaxID=29727 RepID=A0ABC8LRY5_ERUVS|nr:unnamed protein product [Eruca vesicaria subsp. sativa]